MHRHDLDVVYVNYNATDLLADSIASLQRHAGAARIAVRVLVVDNGSRPADAAALEALPGDVTLIRSSRNRGFGAACNLGAEHGRAPFLLFLNPDTLVLAETLPGLVDVLRRHDGEVLAGARQYADRDRCLTIAPFRGSSLWGGASDVLFDRGWLPRRSLSYLRRHMEILSRTDPVPVRQVAGNALAVGRPAFERLGGFDTRFFLYHEDEDLCRRARAAGLPCFYLPGTGIVHWLERSTDTVRSLALESIRSGHEAILRRHHGRAARGLAAIARRAARSLPRIGLRDARAAALDPTRPLPLPRRPGGGRIAVELARSSLFDNCLIAVPEGDAFRLPAEFHASLFPGRYFLRIAVETRPNRWTELSLHRLTKETPAAPVPRRSRPRVRQGP